VKNPNFFVSKLLHAAFYIKQKYAFQKNTFFRKLIFKNKLLIVSKFSSFFKSDIYHFFTGDQITILLTSIPYFEKVSENNKKNFVRRSIGTNNE
jgi:hypothetical protein